MGCFGSTATQQNITTPTKDQHIHNMLKYLKQQNPSASLQYLMLYQQIQECFNQYYWPNQQKSDLLILLQQHILNNYKKNKQSQRQQGKLIHSLSREDADIQFKTKINSLMDEVRDKYKQVYKALEFYKKLSEYNISLKLNDKEQQKKIAQFSKQLKQVSQKFEQCYFYFSLILVRACFKLHLQGVPLKQINERLENMIRFLNKDLIDTPQTEVQAHNLLIYHNFRKDQYNQFSSFTNQQAERKAFYKIQLSGSGQNRLQTLRKQIKVLAQQSNMVINLFNQLIKDSCLKKGKNLKMSLKVKNKDDNVAIQRIQQKIIIKNNNHYVKQQKMDYPSIKKMRQFQKHSKYRQFYKILQQTDRLAMSISDMVRARCLYIKVQDINQTTREIIHKIDQYRKLNQMDVQLLQIDNRLQNITNDIVLKIRINRITCELQLALSNNSYQSFKNQIYHKVYEIGRSKTLTSLCVLLNWHQRLVRRFIQFMTGGLKYKKINPSAQQQAVYDQILNNIYIESDLIQQFKNINKMEHIQPQNEIDKIILQNIKQKHEEMGQSQLNSRQKLKTQQSNKQSRQVTNAGLTINKTDDETPKKK